MLLMNADVSERSLSFANCYGGITYVNSKNTDGNKKINLILDQGQWRDQLRSNLCAFHGEDPTSEFAS